MQATDVTEALMSAYCFCDAGRREVFDSVGKYIEHEAAKTRTQLNQEDGVCQMKVKLADGVPK